MRFCLLAILLVPTITMAGLGWVVVGRANNALREASDGLEVADLVEAASSLDRALADEALLMTQVHADATLQARASRREFVATDEQVAELRRLAQTVEAAPVRRAVVETGSIQGARYDAGLGYITPLQVVYMYSGARRAVLGSVAHMVSDRSTNEAELMAVVAFAEARSAHLDERIAVDLAITYGRWAPGQLGAAIEAIAAQETSLRFADSVQTDRAVLRTSGSLFRTRGSASTRQRLIQSVGGGDICQRHLGQLGRVRIGL